MKNQLLLIPTAALCLAVLALRQRLTLVALLSIGLALRSARHLRLGKECRKSGGLVAALRPRGHSKSGGLAKWAFPLGNSLMNVFSGAVNNFFHVFRKKVISACFCSRKI